MTDMYEIFELTRNDQTHLVELNKLCDRWYICKQQAQKADSEWTPNCKECDYAEAIHLNFPVDNDDADYEEQDSDTACCKFEGKLCWVDKYKDKEKGVPKEYCDYCERYNIGLGNITTRTGMIKPPMYRTQCIDKAIVCPFPNVPVKNKLIYREFCTDCKESMKADIEYERSYANCRKFSDKLCWRGYKEEVSVDTCDRCEAYNVLQGNLVMAQPPEEPIRYEDEDDEDIDISSSPRVNLNELIQFFALNMKLFMDLKESLREDEHITITNIGIKISNSKHYIKIEDYVC